MERRRREDPSGFPSTASSSSRFLSEKFSRNHLKASNLPVDARHLKGRDGKPQRLEREEKQEQDSDNPPSIVGTCPFMCPDMNKKGAILVLLPLRSPLPHADVATFVLLCNDARKNSGKSNRKCFQNSLNQHAGERAQRERLRDLAVFERLNGNPGKTSPSLAVKKFCRTITSKHLQASDVRPLPVLEETLNYLLNLLHSTEHPFEVVHDFIFDRTRSIRQDLSMQNIVNGQTIHMYEEMVKFHIISHHKLLTCSSSPDFSSVHYLNMEQLKKCLTSLYALYEEYRDSNSTYENEPEFRSFHVLLHLGSNNQPLGESLSLWLGRVPSVILKSKEMCFARRVLRSFRMGNYKCFLCTTATEASCLQCYIIEPYINEVRALALSCINTCGYKLHPYPISYLSKLLMMKEVDVESFCNACGLETSSDEQGNKFLPTKQTNFHYPKLIHSGFGAV